MYSLVRSLNISLAFPLFPLAFLSAILRATPQGHLTCYPCIPFQDESSIPSICVFRGGSPVSSLCVRAAFPCIPSPCIPFVCSVVIPLLVPCVLELRSLAYLPRAFLSVFRGGSPVSPLRVRAAFPYGVRSPCLPSAFICAFPYELLVSPFP